MFASLYRVVLLYQRQIDMETLCSLIIACAADLWSMLPAHKSKRFHEFHAKPDGKRWADMFNVQPFGYPSSGPAYHHEWIVKRSRWMTEDNICVFHFEGNRGIVTHDFLRDRYNARPWGTIHVVITKDLKVKTSFREDAPPFPLDYHIRINGWKEVTQEEIDAETSELMVIINEWFLSVLRKNFIKQIKEELVAEVWHPRRLKHLLDTYGWDAVEAL